MHNRVKEVYEQVRMPKKCSRRIEQAMQSKREGTLNTLPGYRRISRPAVALAAVLLLLLADGTVYAATGEGIIRRFASFANNAVFTQGKDEEANGENIDITEQVSEDRAFTYKYTDGQGITHYLIVGGAPETFGYAEFMREETGTQEWISGYSSSGKVGESINPDWLKNAKAELGIPWP